VVRRLRRAALAAAVACAVAATAGAASAHSFVSSLRRRFAKRPTFFAFYVGAQDSRFLAENRQLHRELAAGNVPHVFELYGGGHSQSLWLRHATPWLRLALDHLAPAR